MVARNGWKWAGAAATAAFGSAAIYYWRERALEQPEYALEIEDGQFSVRRYETFLSAVVTVTGERESAQRSGFIRLADYIFAKNRPGEKIAMTAPVMEQRVGRGGGTADAAQASGALPGDWRIRFMMPRAFSEASLPQPPEGIAIERIAERRIAAVRFAGSAREGTLHRREDDLRRWMEREALQPIGDFEYAFYNSPSIPPFLRRNEVLVPIAG